MTKEIRKINSNTLLRKVHMNCPLCGQTHEVEERNRFTSIILKGEEVTYEERFYFCANAVEEENEFEMGAMINENLLNARNAYRIKKGLLTSYIAPFSPAPKSPPRTALPRQKASIATFHSLPSSFGAGQIYPNNFFRRYLPRNK